MVIKNGLQTYGGGGGGQSVQQTTDGWIHHWRSNRSHQVVGDALCNKNRC